MPSPPPDGSSSMDSESTSSSDESSPVNPFSATSDDGVSTVEDDDLRRNTLANSGSGHVQPVMSLKMPPNPFQRAPALQFGGASSTEINQKQLQEHTTPASTSSKPHYDVDDFKRLLLTGEKIRPDKVTPSTPPAQIQGSQMGDTGSNTDTSSISRQSLFEPQHETHPDSPRTSVDISPSDDERHGLIQASPSNSGRVRPSPPAHRHGKLMKHNVPQTVSFESLSSSPPSLALVSATQSSPPGSPMSPTNLNKPLPPPPPRYESPEPLALKQDRMSSQGTSNASQPNLTSPQVPPTLKRSPPAVPAARRHGQGRSRSSTNNSSRSESISEEAYEDVAFSSSNRSNTAISKLPPLPPPRRAGTAPGSVPTTPISDTSSATGYPDTHQSKPRPPAPPVRTPSTNSAKRLSRIAGDAGASSMAPPPPRRRRGSSQSQSSFTPSRLSGEYRMDSPDRQRSDSGISNQPISSLETGAGGKDILADLTALQREVDELRGKFGQ